MSDMYSIALGDGLEEQRGLIYGRMLLDIPREDFGRFRDAWVEIDEQGVLRIAVYTRNGGGNRPDYAEVTAKLRAHPAYIGDKDDTFDSTYATYYFTFPTETPEHLRNPGVWGADDWQGIYDESRDKAFQGPVNMDEVWKQAIAKMKTEGPTPEQMKALAPLAEALKETLGDNPGPINIGVTGRDPKKLFEKE